MVQIPTAQRRKKLRAQIVELFKANPKKTWWFSTLAEATGGDLEDVVEVCRKLAKDGKIFSPHPSRRGGTRTAKKSGGL